MEELRRADEESFCMLYGRRKNGRRKGSEGERRKQLIHLVSSPLEETCKMLCRVIGVAFEEAVLDGSL